MKNKKTPTNSAITPLNPTTADTSLSRSQEKTIENLLECRTIAQAARQSEVSERTIYRWFKQRPFRLALNEARRNAFALANIRLQVLAEQAPDMLEKIIHDRDATAATRVRALTAALKLSHHAIELDDFADRLADLERSRDIVLQKRGNGGSGQ